MNEMVVKFLLALVILWQLFLALLWMRIDQTPPYWDEAWYLYQGAVQYDALRSGAIDRWWIAWTEIDRQRPSLVPLLTTPFYAAGGVQADMGLWLNLLALSGLILATYHLGVILAEPQRALLAAFVIGCYPMIIGLTHILLVELTMTAIVAWTLVALWRSEGFLKTNWSLAAGLLIGLGALTKVFYPIFIIGPAGVTFLLGFTPIVIAASQQRQRCWINLGLSLVAALLVAGGWYIHNLEPMLARSVDVTVGTEAHQYGPLAPLQLDSLARYFYTFVETRLSFLGFLLFLIGILGLWRDRQAWKQPLFQWQLLFLGSSILIGYGFFTSIPNQDPKHVAGILPALAVVTAWGIGNVAGRYWGWALCFVGSILIWNTVAGVLPASLAKFAFKLPLGSNGVSWFYPAQPATVDTAYAAPNSSPWPLYEILNYALFVANLEHLPRDEAHIGIIPNQAGIEEHAFRFEAYRQRMPVQIGSAHPLNLWDQDVLIHKSGDWGVAASVPQIQAITELLDAPNAEFQRMPPIFVLPDGSEVFVYARQPSPLLLDRPAPSCVSDVVFGEAGRLLGADMQLVDSDPTQPILTVTYYWESLKATAQPTTLFVHLMEQQSDQILLQDDHPLFADTYPTHIWQPGRWLTETRKMSLASVVNISSLRLRVGLYDEHGRLPITAPTGRVGANFVDLCPIR